MIEGENMRKANSVITVPILLVLCITVICTIGVLLMNMLQPYIMYEKLLSTSLRYMFVLEEYGYLTEYDKQLLINDLVEQGFEKDDLFIETTQTMQDYGDTVYLSITYYYTLNLPFVHNSTLIVENVPYTNVMKVVKYGISKR